MERWPKLAEDWDSTRETVRRWTQIVGKIRLKSEPMLNHWWNVALYVTQRGLTTSMMPYRDGRTFSIDFDFISHTLVADDCDGRRETFTLEPMSVATFYERTMAALARLDIDVAIVDTPNETPDATPFPQDTVHASYDRDAIERFWRALLQIDRLAKQFRAGFTGKASPVHFFWGSFDLTTTRFSGRSAPAWNGSVPNMPLSAMQEAYSDEEFSVGFWPGGSGAEALLYAYAYPVPDALGAARIKPDAASWSAELREFVLPYEAVRTSADPDRDVLAFFQSTYEAEATLAKWNRSALERQYGRARCAIVRRLSQTSARHLAGPQIRCRYDPAILIHRDA